MTTTKSGNKSWSLRTKQNEHKFYSSVRAFDYDMIIANY